MVKGLIKKSGAILLALSMMAGAFAGCSSSPNAPQKSGADSSAQTSTSGSSTDQGGGKSKITFTMWDAMPENGDFVKGFMAKNPDVQVEIISIPAENYSQKLNTMVATNTAADVMLVWECDLGNFAKGNKLVKLDDYIAKTNAFKADDFIPAMQTLQKMNGATYGLPWCYAAEIMYYNKDMFDKAKVAYPTNDWTWDDFTEAAKKLTIVENGKTVQWGADPVSFVGIWYSTIGAAGDDVVDINGKLAIGDGAKKALQWQYDLTNTLKVSPPPSADTTANDLFMAGKAAMKRFGTWMCAPYRDLEFKWDIAPLPKGERSYSTLHTGLFTIAEQSKNKDAAWKFIEYCMGDEGQELISKGFGNISARPSVAAKGYHKVQGKNGPTNWEAFDKTAQFAQFGYVLLPSGVTSDLAKQFEAAVAGQKSIDQALQEGLEQANKVLGGK